MSTITAMVVAISVWCGGSPSYMEPIKAASLEQFTIEVKYGCRIDKCRQAAMDCMVLAKWDEAKLPKCLGQNPQ